jgi:hypothetical protein
MRMIPLLLIHAISRAGTEDPTTLKAADELEKRLLEEEDMLMVEHLRSEGYEVHKLH